MTPWREAYDSCTVSKAIDCATPAMHNSLTNILRLLDRRGMTRSKPAVSASFALAVPANLAHGRAGSSSTVLEAIRQALRAPPTTPLQTIHPDDAALDALDAGEIMRDPPPGFVRISVLLTEQQALCARQWDEANRKICATKAWAPAGTPSDEQHGRQQPIP